jgi:hypothetical protein
VRGWLRIALFDHGVFRDGVIGTACTNSVVVGLLDVGDCGH